MKLNIRHLEKLKADREHLILELDEITNSKKEPVVKKVEAIRSIKNSINKLNENINSLEREIAIKIEWKNVGNRIIKMFQVQNQIHLEYSKRNVMSNQFACIDIDNPSETEKMLRNYEDINVSIKPLNDKRSALEKPSQLQGEELEEYNEVMTEINKLLHQERVLKEELFAILKWQNDDDGYRARLEFGHVHSLIVEKI